MEKIALAKARPEQITFSSSGPGGGSHLGGELFNMLADGSLPAIEAPQSFSRFLANELTKWTAVVKKAGITANRSH